MKRIFKIGWKVLVDFRIINKKIIILIMKHILFYSIFLACLLLEMTSSCSRIDEGILKNIDTNNKVLNWSEVVCTDTLLVDAWSHDITYEIKCEGEWHVVRDNRFLSCTPESGSGKTMVTVSVQNNQSGEHKVGRLFVASSSSQTKSMSSQALYVEQKSVEDYNGDEEALAKIGLSNKIYAVGYSYDAFDEYASPNSVRMEIFDTRRLIKQSVLALSTPDLKINENIITGSSISELSNKLTVSANVKLGGLKMFSGELGASFDMNHTSNEKYEYAISYLDLEVRRASLSKDLETLKDNYLNDDAWAAINGVPVTNKTGVVKVSYPSTDDGFKRLIDNFGTHVVLSAGLGGRIRYTMVADISKITSAYDLKAFIKASYSVAFVSGDASLSDEFKVSYEENKSNVVSRLNVLGGDENKAKALGASGGGGFTASNLNDWIGSVTAENMALVSFDRNSLIPIYELIDRNATIENSGFDGVERYNKLKEYMERKGESFSTYDSGTVTAFAIPSFDSSQSGETLVKDVMLGGQWVGQICEEYIPLINRNKRVVVLYPVMENKVRYNMGFFIGDDYHKPARVAWNGSSVAIEEYGNLDFGRSDTLYLRGATIYSNSNSMSGLDILKGSVEDEFMEGVMYDENQSRNVMYNYPLVKIFDKVWTREDYCSGIWGNMGRYVNDGFSANDIRREYYSESTLEDLSKSLSGWDVASLATFKSLKTQLEITSSVPGRLLKHGGVTGFDVLCVGWWDGGNWLTYPNRMEYYTSEGCHVNVNIESGAIDILEEKNSIWRMCVRLVKK